MGVMDQGFKAWLDMSKEALLTWVLGAPVTFLGKFPGELAPAPQLLPDSFQRISVAGEECLANIEVQTTIDRTMGRRLYEYGSRADTDSGLAVYSVVLWLFKDPQGHRPPKSPYQRVINGQVRAWWVFDNIELYELPPDAIMNAGVVSLLPLLPFTKNATLEQIEAAMQRVKDEAPAEQARPLAGLLGIFTSRFFDEQRAVALLERLFMSTEIMEEFPLFRTWMAQATAKGEAIGRAEGEAEGKAIGRAEGRAEGEAEGERNLLRRLLERRFGALSDELQQAISAADTDALTEVALAAGTETLEQLRARLGLNGAQG